MKTIEEIKKKLLAQNSYLKEIINNYDVTSVDNYGNNILHYYIKNINAINVDSALFITLLKEKGLNLNANQSKGPKNTALHLAILTKNKTITTLIVSLGVDVNITNVNGNTPISEAIMHYKDDDPFFIEYLASNGANINLKNNYGVSPYSLSETIANYDSKKILKPYVEKGSD